MEIFNSFADNESTIRVESIWNCLVGLGLSAFFNLILGEIYKVMNKTKQNNYIMMQSMVFISVILAGAMMVIGNNLAVAFGLVGAVSIIRFRTSVNSFIDMSFIFLSIVIGMANGLGFYLIAAVIAVFTGILMLAVHFSGFGKKYFLNHMELDITITFFQGEDNTLPGREHITKAVTEAGGGQVSFLEYKGRSDSVEIKFRTVWTDINNVQNIDSRLRESFPDGNYTIKATRV